ncbi:hypothetical protein E2C01_068258 [Portunus trituberculatus]|uniref:Uncharacterized protein n=1 Tax=Portunus trituberculatus TaxID=210409 RepID=A0A5B7HVS7_PORTR|nr:hypothetical protein [Portunus trituberculatus]
MKAPPRARPGGGALCQRAPAVNKHGGWTGKVYTTVSRKFGYKTPAEAVAWRQCRGASESAGNYLLCAGQCQRVTGKAPVKFIFLTIPRSLEALCDLRGGREDQKSPLRNPVAVSSG